MLSFFLSYLLVYRYSVLFLVVLTASFGLPVPATALLMAAWAFSAQGYMDIEIVFLSTFFASVIGDHIGYFVSSCYGRDLLMRIGFRRLLTSERFVVVENLFVHYSITAIFSTRFVATSLGPAVNILAGLSGVSFKKFLGYDLLGEALYVVIFAGLGYAFGDQWEYISSIGEDITSIFVLIFLLLAAFLIVWRMKSR